MPTGKLFEKLMGNGPGTWFTLPMLGYPKEWYPRYRECQPVFNEKTQEWEIHILTALGSLDHHCGLGEEKVFRHPNFLGFYDMPGDLTKGVFRFSVPPKWLNDFLLIREGRFSEVTDEYREQCKTVFPKQTERFQKLFGGNL